MKGPSAERLTGKLREALARPLSGGAALGDLPLP